MNCTEEFIAKMKQKDIVINFVQAWRNDTLEESYARLDKPTRLHAYSVSKSVTFTRVTARSESQSINSTHNNVCA